MRDPRQQQQLSDEQWEQIEALFLFQPGRKGFRPNVSKRQVFEAVLYRERAGGHHQTTCHNIMNQGAKRSVLRWIHIIFGVPILGYIYSPFEELPNHAFAVRFIFLPAIVLSGFWMWKGDAFRRLVSKRPA